MYPRHAYTNDKWLHWLWLFNTGSKKEHKNTNSSPSFEEGCWRQTWAISQKPTKIQPQEQKTPTKAWCQFLEKNKRTLAAVRRRGQCAVRPLGSCPAGPHAAKPSSQSERVGDGPWEHQTGCVHFSALCMLRTADRHCWYRDRNTQKRSKNVHDGACTRSKRPAWVPTGWLTCLPPPFPRARADQRHLCIRRGRWKSNKVLRAIVAAACVDNWCFLCRTHRDEKIYNCIKIPFSCHDFFGIFFWNTGMELAQTLVIFTSAISKIFIVMDAC